MIMLGTGGINKPFLIPGKVMMVTMHHIDKFLGSFTVRNGMKSKTMHQVFKECPEKSPRRKGEKYPGIAEFQSEND